MLARLVVFVIDLFVIVGMLILVFHPMLYLGVTAHTILASVLNGAAMSVALIMYFFLLSFMRGKRTTQKIFEVIYFAIVTIFFLVAIHPLTYKWIVAIPYPPVPHP
jgi:hypothetical protein